MKRVLMVAYHFPPLAGSSGIQRTLRFVQQLPRFGWEPLVLTAHPFAYEQTSADLTSEIPAGTVVRRAFALDTARHLSIRGRYAGAFARPDRWMSWKFDGVRQGMRLIREFEPQALWSTYPIATAHTIAAELHRRSGLPWIADFRDPMAQDDYPADPAVRARLRNLEQEVVLRAQRCMLTTPGAVRNCRNRHPAAGARIRLLENGYDEDSFLDAESGLSGVQALEPGAITLLHSGIVYPSERDPGPLFTALGRLLRAGLLDAGNFRLRLRAPVHEKMLADLARTHGIERLVTLLPPVAYRQALQEMLRADALLVMQGANCNEQIPAKAYEYMRARRPTLCLADPAGDTAAVMRNAGVGHIAPLESVEAIASLLPGFLDAVRQRLVRPIGQGAADGASRARRAQVLALELDAVTAEVQRHRSPPLVRA